MRATARCALHIHQILIHFAQFVNQDFVIGMRNVTLSKDFNHKLPGVGARVVQTIVYVLLKLEENYLQFGKVVALQVVIGFLPRVNVVDCFRNVGQTTGNIWGRQIEARRLTRK